MATLEIAIILGSLALGWAIAEHYTRGAEALLTARQVIFGVAAVIIALAAISTGSLENMILGGIVLVFAAMWVVLRGDDAYEGVTG